MQWVAAVRSTWCVPTVIRLKSGKRLSSEWAHEAPPERVHLWAERPLTHISNTALRTATFSRRWRPSRRLLRTRSCGIWRNLGRCPLPLTLERFLRGSWLRCCLATEKLDEKQLDEKQYGNLKGKSAPHFLIFILVAILKGLDRLETFVTSMLQEGVWLRGPYDRRHATVSPELPSIQPGVQGRFPERTPSRGVLPGRAFGLWWSHLWSKTRAAP